MLVIVVVCRQCSWVGRLVAFEAYMVPSCSMKASPQDGSFRVRPSSGPLGLISEVHGIFSNRDLPVTSGRQPKPLAIVSL